MERLRRRLRGTTRMRCAKPMARSSFPVRRISSTMAVNGLLIRSITATSEIADLLKREPSLKLLVVGHTDNVGDFESNRNLSQRRAESVANALVTGFGIAPDRLVPFGVSYAAPVASNATPEGRSQNRRVELVHY